MGSKLGHKLRPTVEREKLYRLVLQLREGGLSYNQIIRKVEADCGVSLRKSHISGWINGKHKPFGYERAFEPTPTPELAYVVGVSLGDGSTSNSKNYSHRIKLRVIDREFAEEFARCLGVLLSRNPPNVKWREKTHSWYTEVSSLLLQKFLRKPLQELKGFIEASSECVSAFLRGFFDSEGWVYRTELGVANTNVPVLEYVSKLLESKFGIKVYGPRLKSRGGRTVVIKGRLYHANKDCYALLIDRKSLTSYQRLVGFTIRRKQERLASAILKLG